MNEYLLAKSHLCTKLTELFSDIALMEQQADDMYKVALYLIRKYKDDLIKEFDLKPVNIPSPWVNVLETTFDKKVDTQNDDFTILRIINMIKDKMKEEMPEPWYCYIGGNN